MSLLNIFTNFIDLIGEGPGVSLLNGFTNSYPPPQAGYTPPSQFVSVNQPIPLASMSSMGIIPPPKV